MHYAQIIITLTLTFLTLASLQPAAAEEKFVTALTGKFPPFSYYDNQGNFSGFDVDVSREIAQRINRKLRIIATEWEGIPAGLPAEKYDAVTGSMRKNKAGTG